MKIGVSRFGRYDAAAAGRARRRRPPPRRFVTRFEGAPVIRQNRSTQHAIAALSRLAELYNEPDRRASSIEIARNRNLPKPVVAKILTILAQAGLVTGAPGPGGGYRLARPPAEISLRQVADLFDPTVVAFGGGPVDRRESGSLTAALVLLALACAITVTTLGLALWERRGAAPPGAAQPAASRPVPRVQDVRRERVPDLGRTARARGVAEPAGRWGCV